MKNLSKLQQLKNQFYVIDGTISIEHYGIFNQGLTREEIENYLRVRADSMNIKKILKKFWEYGRGSTGACVILDGKEYHLVYRSDVEHWADCIFDKVTFIMD